MRGVGCTLGRCLTSHSVLMITNGMIVLFCHVVNQGIDVGIRGSLKQLPSANFIIQKGMQDGIKFGLRRLSNLSFSALKTIMWTQSILDIIRR